MSDNGLESKVAVLGSKFEAHVKSCTTWRKVIIGLLILNLAGEGTSIVVPDDALAAVANQFLPGLFSGPQ